MSPPQRVQAKFHIRLMVGLPALLSLYMLISGWAAYPVIYESFFAETLPMDLFRKAALGFMLFMILLAFIGNLGAGIVISRHIKRYILKLESSLRLESPSRSLIEATDEIEALGIVVDEVSTTLSKFVNDNYIIENLPEAVITVDSDLRIIRLNGNAARLLGVDADQALGRNLTEFVTRDRVNAGFLDMIEYGIKTGHFPLKLVRLRIAGSETQEYWVEIHPLKGRMSPTGMGCVSISIKNKASILAVKNQIQKIERLAAIGGVASTIAHEVRNPLGAIRTFTELLQEDLPAEDKKKLRYTGQILNQIDRLNQLIENILAFSRDSITVVKDIDIKDLLSRTVQLVKGKFTKSPVTIHEEYQPGLPQLKGDPEKLSQAFLNILINAFEACGEEGTVHVAAGCEPEGDGNAGVLCVTITDTGKGIPEEVMNKILDPFFTTKPKGTGLGLAISQNIVAAHGGKIEVKSEIGKGTTFQLLLPQSHDFSEGPSEEEWSYFGYA